MSTRGKRNIGFYASIICLSSVSLILTVRSTDPATENLTAQEYTFLSYALSQFDQLLSLRLN